MMNHTSPRAPASLDPWQRDVSCVDVRAVGMAIRGELAFGRGFHLLLCFGRRICRHSRIPQQGYREGGPCHVDNSKGIRGVQVLEIAGYVVLGASRAPSFSSLHRHCAGGEGEAICRASSGARTNRHVDLSSCQSIGEDSHYHSHRYDGANKSPVSPVAARSAHPVPAFADRLVAIRATVRHRCRS